MGTIVQSDWSAAVPFTVQGVGNSYAESSKIAPTTLAANDYFGARTAISADGKVLLISAIGNSTKASGAGAVYHYAKVAGSWVLQGMIYASDAAAADQFGSGLALNNDGTVALIGAHQDDDKGTDSGSVYYFTRVGITWTQVSKFNSDDCSAGDLFGGNIGISGDGAYAVVGAQGDNRFGTTSGSAYIFRFVNGTWVQHQKLFSSIINAGDGFGRSVAISADANFIAVGGFAADPSLTDSGAVYIFKKLDEFWVEQTRVTPADPIAAQYFGTGVALDETGETLIVGAAGDDGKAVDAGGSYFFTRVDSRWIQKQHLFASDGLASDGYGVVSAVSGDGNVLAVGAIYSDTIASNAGAVYILNRVTNTYLCQQKTYANDAAVNDNLGIAVAISGDAEYAFVGAHGDDDAGVDTGSVYVFTRSGNAWVQRGKITAPDPQAFDYFGVSVATNANGSYLIVGAFCDDDKAADAGSVYVFTRTGISWAFQAKLLSSDGAASDYFGMSVALSADASYALIGAQSDDDKGTDAGAVYVFVRAGVTWSQQQKFYAADAQAGDAFGISVALNTDATYALIGAMNDDDKATDAGSVYAFTRNGTTWTQVQKFYANDALTSDGFGVSVSLSADATYAVIGAYANDDKGGNSGSVYIFTRADGVWSQKGIFYASDATEVDIFGCSVSMSADATYVLVGARLDDDKTTDAGAFYTFIATTPLIESGAPVTKTEWTATDKLFASDAAAGNYFGAALAVSSDGLYAFIGTYYDDDKATDAGALYVFTRSGEVWTQQTKIYASDAQATDYFGVSVASNSDGTYLLVGSFSDDDKGTDAGSVYVFVRSGVTWTQQQKLYASDAQDGDGFGIRVALNVDATYALIGAHLDDDKASNAGSVYVFTRSGTVWTQQQKIYPTDTQEHDYFGSGLALSANANYALIGAHGDDDKATDSGSVYVFTRSGTVWTQQQKLYAGDPTASSSFGISVALNSDASLAVVGACFDGVKGPGSGAVYVFARNGDIWTQTAKIYSSIPTASESFGSSVALPGDGAFILIGAFSDGFKGSNAGSVYSYSLKTIESEPLLTSGLRERCKLTSSDVLASDAFSTGIAMTNDGSIAFIAAQNRSDSGTKTGVVYVFTRIGASWTQRQKILAPDPAAADMFGVDVATNGDGKYLFVGAHQDDDSVSDSGSVYIFTKSSDTWIYTGKLHASSPVAGACFGRSVATSNDGSYLLTGAINDSTKGNVAGSVYVFVKSGATWIQQQILYAGDAVAEDHFGTSIALNADATIAVIGAVGGTSGTYSGAAYVFTRVGMLWTQQQKIATPDPVANDNFGVSSSLTSDASVLYIGAYGKDTAGTDVGCVYQYRRLGVQFIFVKKIYPSEPTANQFFGYSIAQSGDGKLVLIGSVTDPEQVAAGGSVYVYAEGVLNYAAVNQADLILRQKIWPNVKAATGQFGHAIAVSADQTRMLVGENSATSNSLAGAGRCNSYKKLNGNWVFESSFYPADVAANDSFGCSVAISADGTIALVGSCLDDDKATDAGSVYAFSYAAGTWTQTQKFTAADGIASDYFGVHVAMSADGSTALIAAWGSDDKATSAGAVYVYVRGNAVWRQQQKLYSADAAANFRFGDSVALSGDGNYALVSAGLSDAAAARTYVFMRVGAFYVQQQMLTPPDNAVGDGFGQGCALNVDGSIAVIGAYLDDDSGANSGSIYVYTRVNGTWSFRRKFVSDEAVSGNIFGNAVAISPDGSVIFVGGEGDPDLGTNSGAAYVFDNKLKASDMALPVGYSHLYKFTSSDDQASDRFGSRIAVSGDGKWALIGAAGDDDKATDAGSVYFFYKSGDVWIQQQKIYSSDIAASDFFGSGLALNYDASIALIGCPNKDDKGTDAGCVYVFTRIGTTWTQQQKLYSVDLAANDAFGLAVALNADATIALIGAYSDSDNGSQSGSVYVFVRSGAVWVQQQKLHASDAQATDYFGWSVALSSDGVHALIGADGDDDKGLDTGAVYYFTRSGAIWTQVSKFYPDDAMPSTFFGASVAINTDGTRAIVGSTERDDIVTDSGAAYVFTRNEAVWTQQQKFYAPDAAASDYFGHAIAMSSDGRYALICSMADDDRATNGGSVYCFGLETEPFAIDNDADIKHVQKLLPQAASVSGVSVSDDGNYMLIGEPEKAVGAKGGCVNVYLKVNGAWVFQIAFTASDGAAGDLFGYSVTLNNDATIAAIGAIQDDDKGVDSGSVYIFTRSDVTWTQVQKLTANDGVTLDYFGAAVAMSGDSNVLFITATGDDDVASSSGSVYVFVKGASAASWRQQQKIMAPDSTVGDMFGRAVATTGNGDILLVSAEAALTNAGVVRVYYRSGLRWLFQQSWIQPLPSEGNYFGSSIGISSDGTVAVVGDVFTTTFGANTGSAFLYTRNGPVWSFRRRFLGKDIVSGSCFGRGVAVDPSGTSLTVSAMNDNEYGTSAGAVYLLENKMKPTDIANPGGLLQYSKFTPNDLSLSDGFGISTAMNADGTLALVGCYLDDDKATNAGSVYVFTRVGTVWTQQQKFYASDAAADDWFGLSVALSADASIALIGAGGDDDTTTDTGSVYVFTRSGTTWTQQQKLHAADAPVYAAFGGSVALNADATIALIGANGADITGTDSGAVYFFKRVGTVWTQVQKFIPGDSAAGDQFGRDVALNADGSIAIIGALRDDDKGTNTGSVYYYTRTGDVWTQQSKFYSFEINSGAQTGVGVALSADGLTAFVGTPLDVNRAGTYGSIAVFSRATGSWIQEQKHYSSGYGLGRTLSYGISVSADASMMLASGYSDGDSVGSGGAVYFFAKETLLPFVIDNVAGVTQVQKILPPVAGGAMQRAVALSGDETILLLGAPTKTVASKTGAGAVEVYVKSNGIWTYQQSITPTDSAQDDYFGFSIATNADATITLIGAYYDDDKAVNSGSVYAFTRVGTVWTQQQKILPSDAVAYDCFGSSVALSPDASIAFIGAPYDDDKAADAGSVYIFTRSGTVWTYQQKLLDPNGVAGDLFGAALAASADGKYLAVSSYGAAVRQGRVYIYKRTDSLWVQQACLTAPGGITGNYFGSGVAFNTDASILLVGIWTDASLNASNGAMLMFTRIGGTWTYRRKVYPNDTLASSFGICVAMNQLGTQLFASSADTEAGAGSGAAYQFSNTLKASDVPVPTGLTQVQKLLANDAAASDFFGYSVALNADASYLLVGATDSDIASQTGSAYVFIRNNGVWTQQQQLHASDAAVSDYFGASVALNADATYALIGAHGRDDSVSNAGAVYVFTRIGTVWTQQAKLHASDAQATDYFGISVALSTDATYAVIGAHTDDDKGTDAGAVYVFTRSGSTWTQQQKFYAADAKANEYFGISVALSADATYCLVGSHYNAGKTVDGGAVYVFTRSGSVWTQQTKLYASDARLNDYFGTSVALNADATIALIGAVGRDDAGVDAGAVYILTRSGATWTEQNKIYALDAKTGDQFGRSVALSSDGKLAVIGASVDDESLTDQGSVYFFADLIVHPEFI